MIFFATLQPISLDPLNPNSLLGLGPSEVILSWPDVTDRSQEPTVGPDDAPLLPFLDVVANQLTLGGMQIGSALRSLSQTDGNVLSEDLALTGNSVGEILDSPVEQVRPVDLADGAILHVSAIFEDADFKKFHVVTAVNLPALGVATGDAVSYKDQNGNVVSGTVDSAGASEFVVRFIKSSSSAGTSLVDAHIRRLAFRIGGAPVRCIPQPAGGSVGRRFGRPHVAGFYRATGRDDRRADRRHRPDRRSDRHQSVSADRLRPQAGWLVFEQEFKPGVSLQGSSFETGGDFAVTLEPSFRLDLGLDMRADVSGIRQILHRRWCQPGYQLRPFSRARSPSVWL